MMKFENAVRVVAGLVALLIIAPPSATALERKPTAAQMLKRPAAHNKLHRLILQVNTNEPAMMNLALNNATNVAQYYKDLGEKVAIEVVTFGPGADQGDQGEHARNLFQGLRQHPGKYAQGREQGNSHYSRGDSREVRRCACNGAAGARLDLRQAVTWLDIY